MTVYKMIVVNKTLSVRLYSKNSLNNEMILQNLFFGTAVGVKMNVYCFLVHIKQVIFEPRCEKTGHRDF